VVSPPAPPAAADPPAAGGADMRVACGVGAAAAPPAADGAAAAPPCAASVLEAPPCAASVLERFIRARPPVKFCGKRDEALNSCESFLKSHKSRACSRLVRTRAGDGANEALLRPPRRSANHSVVRSPGRTRLRVSRATCAAGARVSRPAGLVAR